MITTACPHCHSNFQVAPEHAGQQVSCPSCQQAVVVPSDTTAGAAGAPVGPSEASGAKPGSKKNLIIISSVGLVAIIGVLLYVFVFNSGAAGFSAFNNFKKAVEAKDYKAIFNLVDDDGQSSLLGLADGDSDAASLEGEAKYAKYMENITSSPGAKRGLMIVSKWTEGWKVIKSSLKSDSGEITIKYQDKSEEKVDLKKTEKGWRFVLKPNAPRFYSIITANYAGGLTGGPGPNQGQPQGMGGRPNGPPNGQPNGPPTGQPSGPPSGQGGRPGN